MKPRRTNLWLGSVAFVAPLAFLLAGCEVDSASRRIEIRPDSATLEYGQSVTLTAYYGYIYDWSLSDTTLGVLNTRRGSAVVYTSLSAPAEPTVQIVTVQSTFSDNVDDSGSSTNGSAVVHSAEAFITHISVTN